MTEPPSEPRFVIHQPGSYLDHMMRQTRSHHAELSAMADLKANMLLTIASVVFTMGATRIQIPELRWALATLLPFCLVTAMLAAYATMPDDYSRKQDPRAPKPGDPGFNIFFFGHFFRMPYDEYRDYMEHLMNDPSIAYEAQVREVHTLGVFLARKKYRALRLAYLVFIAGLVSSGMVALVLSLWKG